MYINNDINYLKYLKSKKVILFGAGKEGQKTFHKLMQGNIEVVAFCDNDERKQNKVLMNVRIISMEELIEKNNNDIIIVISSRFEREIRNQLLEYNVHNFISVSQIDFGGGEAYYDELYFEWQKKMGSFGGKIKAAMFKPYIKPEMTVVEFGGGGGYLLNNIDAKEKIIIEINATARAEAEKTGIRCVKSISEINDNYADVIISTSVLEHVENPYSVLKKLHSKLKDSGKIIFHVPNESCDTEYSRSEVNNHLYTWNCLTIGNLFKAAGYFVYSVQKIQEVWPKNYFEIEQQVSPEIFETICDIGGKAFDENRCLIIAYK